MPAEATAPRHRLQAALAEGLRRCAVIAERSPPPVEGRLTRIVGLTLEAVGCNVPLGGRCRLYGGGGQPVEAEVVGFDAERTFLMPIDDLYGLLPGARVRPGQHRYELPVGEDMLGRVIDGRGRPLDGRGAWRAEARRPLYADPINPLARRPIDTPLDVGVRAINGLFTVGRGQRMGLFAGSGVGKSVLLGMMTRYTQADVTVVGLIGERGREVNEFVQNILGENGRRRAVVVAVPADQPPLLRAHGALLATAVAEFFRDRGLQVLLLMDSLTRYAQALREIALAIGEPPATKGYPPSVFARLPQLVERAGPGGGEGAITAFYTVLTEGDDPNDPVADAARAVLDGHIVLSRQVAEGGRYPAVDVETSVSRLAAAVTDETHQQRVQRFRRLWARYNENRDLIRLGVYKPGSDAEIDEAIALYPRLSAYLAQHMRQAVGLEASIQELARIFQEHDRDASSGGRG